MPSKQNLKARAARLEQQRDAKTNRLWVAHDKNDRLREALIQIRDAGIGDEPAVAVLALRNIAREALMND